MSTTTTTTETPTVTIWTIDPTHTNVEFAVRHLMITTVKGRFADVKGTVWLDESDRAASQADITISAASIDTREAQRDAHLRSADFFDVEKFPTLTFRSTAVKDASRDHFTLVGDLTIRGVTRQVALDVTAEGRGKDPWGGERTGFSATTKINRRDFGLTWNIVLEAGGVTVGDEVKIAIDAELVRS